MVTATTSKANLNLQAINTTSTILFQIYKKIFSKLRSIYNFDLRWNAHNPLKCTPFIRRSRTTSVQEFNFPGSHQIIITKLVGFHDNAKKM